MDEKEGLKEVTKPCRDRFEFGRVLCSLPMGHVRSETDWHQGKATVATFEQGSFHSVKHDSTEVIRWAPYGFEIPRKPKAEPED